MLTYEDMKIFTYFHSCLILTDTISEIYVDGIRGVLDE